MDPDTPVKKTRNSLNLTLDYRVVVGVLLLIIAIMLLIWKPWTPQIDAQSRTIDVTGEAKITATPDEFIFTPAYEFKNDNRETALADLSKKSEEVVKKLKELGVNESKIKTNSEGYDYPVYDKQNTTTPTYTLRLTITINDKDMAQKVQDYLVSTTPTGAVSPQLTFSEGKRKELEAKARDEATKEARNKAEQSAKNLGFSLGEVKSVNDGMSFDGFQSSGGGVSPGDASESSKLNLQPGENDLTYRVSVVYYLR